MTSILTSIFRPPPNSNGGYIEGSEGWSQELVLTSKHDGAFQWTADAYYFDLKDYNSFYIYEQTVRDDSTRPVIETDQGTFIILEGTDIVSDATLLNGFFANAVEIETEYWGLFAQGEYSLTDSLRLIAGMRYNDETKSTDCGGSNFTGDTNGDGVIDRVVNVKDGVVGSSPLILPEIDARRTPGFCVLDAGGPIPGVTSAAATWGLPQSGCYR
ncbi:hypothetical protein CWI75_15375 [Kineobactrum sediminis]|uniref:Uncharacterized protein n=1 Tax=Kineobactrum sediminis TaxID=1905677 RepID=A0A2N5XZ34_9GAMM|nr:TonB-dependent receptor [Kineobactrum sediminis]PLW81410.1 hypothetical protein CWI75_15375 [Kineobactrum sediminis]